MYIVHVTYRYNHRIPCYYITCLRFTSSVSVIVITWHIRHVCWTLVHCVVLQRKHGQLRRIGSFGARQTSARAGEKFPGLDRSLCVSIENCDTRKGSRVLYMLGYPLLNVSLKKLSHIMIIVRYDNARVQVKWCSIPKPWNDMLLWLRTSRNKHINCWYR